MSAPSRYKSQYVALVEEYERFVFVLYGMEEGLMEIETVGVGGEATVIRMEVDPLEPWEL